MSIREQLDAMYAVLEADPEGALLGGKSFAPPYHITRDGRMERLAQDQVAATLVAGMLRPEVDPVNVVELFREVRAALYPAV